MISTPSLALADARVIAAANEAYAITEGLRLAVAVLDAGGNLLLVERMDGTQLAGAQVAIAKARTALMFGKPSRSFDDGAREGRPALAQLPTAIGGLAVEGGLPVRVEDHGPVVGAVGVSGSTSRHDADAALAAIAVWVAHQRSEPG